MRTVYKQKAIDLPDQSTEYLHDVILARYWDDSVLAENIFKTEKMTKLSNTFSPLATKKKTPAP